jgi:hypothetical protein
MKSRMMRWTGHVAHMEEMKNVYKVLVEKPEGKRPLGRPTRRWEDTITKDFERIFWKSLTGFIWLRIGTSGGLL